MKVFLQRYIGYVCVLHLEINTIPTETIFDIKQKMAKIIYNNIYLTDKITIFENINQNTNLNILNNDYIIGLCCKDNDTLYFQCENY